MRFAVVGDPSSAAGLLQAIARHAEHEVVAFALAGESLPGLPALAPGAKVCRHWEELAADARLETLIVAGDDDEVLQAPRQLAAAGKGLIVAPLVGRSATLAYELTLVQDEQPIRLAPLFVRRAHPLVRRVRETLASGRLGPVRHVVLERRLTPSVRPGAAGGLSSADLAGAFVADADLLRSIWGEFDTVTAMRTGDPAGSISLATITLAGPAAPSVVWSATPGSADPPWRLHVVAAQGTLTLCGSGNGDDLQLETALAGSSAETESMTFDGNDWFLTGFAALPESSSTVAPARAPDAVPLATWTDFTRAAELFDAAERSIRRRRTIEIHFEAPSERGQFKTQMTAAGCTLLTLTLAATIVYLTVNSLIELPTKLKQVLVAAIFLPLGLFLALQGLYFLTRPSSGDGAMAGNEPQEPEHP